MDRESGRPSARGSGRVSGGGAGGDGGGAGGAGGPNRNVIIAAVVGAVLLIVVVVMCCCGGTKGNEPVAAAPAAAPPPAPTQDKAADDDGDKKEEASGDHIKLAETMRTLSQFWQGRLKGFRYGSDNQVPTMPNVYNRYRKEPARKKKGMEGNVAGYIVGDMCIAKKRFDKWDIFQFSAGDVGEIKEIDNRLGQARVEVYTDQGYTTFANNWRGGGAQQDAKRQLWMTAAEILDTFNPAMTAGDNVRQYQDEIAEKAAELGMNKDGKRKNVEKNMAVLGWKWDQRAMEWQEVGEAAAQAALEGTDKEAKGDDEEAAAEASGDVSKKTEVEVAWGGMKWIVDRRNHICRLFDTDIGALQWNPMLPEEYQMAADWFVGENELKCDADDLQDFLHSDVVLGLGQRGDMMRKLAAYFKFYTNDWVSEQKEQKEWAQWDNQFNDPRVQQDATRDADWSQNDNGEWMLNPRATDASDRPLGNDYQYGMLMNEKLMNEQGVAPYQSVQQSVKGVPQAPAK